MKTYLDCIPCFMQQALRAGRLATNNEEKIKQLLDDTGDLIKHISMEKTPAEVGEVIYAKIREVTGIYDPYKDIKTKSIAEAKLMIPELKSILDKSENRLITSIRMAIAGNIIDFGMSKKFNLKEDLKRILTQDFAYFDFKAFEQHLKNAKTILYIADNAGESVFDRILIKEMGKKTYYAVREVPVINDVISEDAIASGLDEVSEIVSSGSHVPGTILSTCSAEFNQLFKDADLIISKGQGNYEGLSDEKRSVFFMLKAKCHVIAKDLGIKENDIVLKGINI
ncbi:MAG: ARMT1-like domain-containing protein [Bacteroidales bacterium]|jgi:uncharacterized protein with ATP-grasp and redox domains|nr:ARMT1-like domain-containing protein [Bacteroidales bacterium]